MKIIPIHADLNRLIKKSLLKFKRSTLLENYGINQTRFISNLNKACNQKTSTSVLRVSYETERYVNESIIEGKTRKFASGCKNLRHQERIVMTNYVKAYLQIPELVEKVQNHMFNIKVEEKEKNYNDIEKSLLSLDLSDEQREYLKTLINPLSQEQKTNTEELRKKKTERDKVYKDKNPEKVKAVRYVCNLNKRDILPLNVDKHYAELYKIYHTNSGYALEEQVIKRKLKNPFPLFGSTDDEKKVRFFPNV